MKILLYNKNMNEYNNKINFDESSIEWRKNKKYLGNGFFEYKCLHISSNGKYCKNKVFRERYCKYHYNNYNHYISYKK